MLDGNHLKLVDGKLSCSPAVYKLGFLKKTKTKTKKKHVVCFQVNDFHKLVIGKFPMSHGVSYKFN